MSAKSNVLEGVKDKVKEIKENRETKYEKVLKLSKEELIAKAISDLLKRDDDILPRH